MGGKVIVKTIHLGVVQNLAQVAGLNSIEVLRIIKRINSNII